ncbi:MAG: DUF1365 domain-containing protein [Thermocrispum sp.]
MQPALYEATTVHMRRRPWPKSFRHRFYLWHVDLDRLPVLPRVLRPFARFDPRDHGQPGHGHPSIRAEYDAWLAEQGVLLPGGRITMLASARVAGYVFNPLSVFWCYHADGSLACAVAEVHNTYRGRHRYLLRPDQHGAASTAKEFAVSPFFTVDGQYRIRVPEPGERLAVSVALRQDGEQVFAATLHGRKRPGTPRTLLGLLVRHPLAPLVATVAIRVRGIGLWLRGLPVVGRPEPTAGTPRTEEVVR